MKLSFKQIESFVKSPDPKARAILVYGPDQGLMKERSRIMAKTVNPDLNDPFNVIQGIGVIMGNIGDNGLAGLVALILVVIWYKK